VRVGSYNDLEKASSAVKKLQRKNSPSFGKGQVKAVKEMWTIATDGQFMKMKQRMSRETGEKNPATRLMKKHD